MIQVIAVWLTLLSSPTPISQVHAGQVAQVHVMVKNTTGTALTGRTWFSLGTSEWFADSTYNYWLTDTPWTVQVPLTMQTGKTMLTATALEGTVQASTPMTVLPPPGRVYLPILQTLPKGVFCLGDVCIGGP